MADMLLVKMAADKNSKGNLFTAGSKILTEHMKIVSKNKNVLLTNGSGLSTSNRFSVRDLNSLLIDAAKDFLISPDYISSLPLARTEGSLKRRFKSKNI